MKKVFFISVLATLAACTGGQKSEPVAEAFTEPTANTLSDQEKQEGWKLLFDGTSMSGWRMYQNKSADAWSVVDGTLYCAGSVEQKGDERPAATTEEEFANFELTLEWKVAPGSNSGLMFRVTEEAKAPYMSGPEYQLIDAPGWQAAHPNDSFEPDQSVAANYDMHVASSEPVKPVGEWNLTRLVVNGAHVEHWLNGEKVVEYELWTPDWEERAKNSKWKEHKGYGRATKGHISLQDHGDPVWFRNIKIKEL